VLLDRRLSLGSFNFHRAEWFEVAALGFVKLVLFHGEADTCWTEVADAFQALLVRRCWGSKFWRVLEAGSLWLKHALNNGLLHTETHLVVLLSQNIHGPWDFLNRFIHFHAGGVFNINSGRNYAVPLPWALPLRNLNAAETRWIAKHTVLLWSKVSLRHQISIRYLFFLVFKDAFKVIGALLFKDIDCHIQVLHYYLFVFFLLYASS